MPTALQRSGDFSRTLNSSGNPITIYDPRTSSPNPAVPGQFTRTPFAGNRIPAQRFDLVAMNILNYIPLPNTAGNPFTGTNNYVTSSSGLIQKDTFSIRGDHSFTDSQKLFMRFSINKTAVNRPLIYGPNYAVSAPVTG